VTTVYATKVHEYGTLSICQAELLDTVQILKLQPVIICNLRSARLFTCAEIFGNDTLGKAIITVSYCKCFTLLRFVQTITVYSPLTWGIFDDPPSDIPECGFVGEFCLPPVRGKSYSFDDICTVSTLQLTI